MSEQSERFAQISAAFTATVEGVQPDQWESPAPCEGWVARDVVDHLTGWVPGFFQGHLSFAAATGDRAADWKAVRDVLQAALDDPAVAGADVTSQAGTHKVENAIDMFVTGDVLVHTWDLARATGQDETLDAAAVSRMLEGMLPMDEVLRSSGQFGPRVQVPEGASTQDQLIAFTGRQP